MSHRVFIFTSVPGYTQVEDQRQDTALALALWSNCPMTNVTDLRRGPTGYFEVHHVPTQMHPIRGKGKVRPPQGCQILEILELLCTKPN